MKLNCVRVFVDDPEVARRFYRDVLGFTIKWDGGSAMGFDVGIELIIESVDADAPADDRALVGRFVGCSFDVDDIDASYESLSAKGVEFTGPPERQPWGGWLAHFEDGNGNILTLVGKEASTQTH